MMTGSSDTDSTCVPMCFEWITDAITRIKSHKQRPEKERICQYVQQQHDVTSAAILLELEKAIEKGFLETVCYSRGKPDQLTYVIKRYPLEHKNERKKVKIVRANTNLSKYIVDALKGMKRPSSVKDIVGILATKGQLQVAEGVDLSTVVRVSARRAESNGILSRSNNLYKLNSVSANGPKQKKEAAKPHPICSFCLGTILKNTKTGKPEEMISCHDCGQSGHPSCLNFSQQLTQAVKKLHWQCLDCKTCSTCHKTKKTDDMLFCDRCDRAFHLYCCKPPVKKPPTGLWQCHLCHSGQRLTNTTLSSVKTNVKVSKATCPTPGCDGRGNVNGKLSSHRRQTACPLVPKHKRKRMKEGKVLVEGEVSESASETEELSSAGVTTDEEQREESKNDSSSQLKDLGLVDGLSRFFTPSAKRKSRVSLNSLLPAVESPSHKQVTVKSSKKSIIKKPSSKSQAAANKILKKSRSVQQMKHAGETRAVVRRKSEDTEASSTDTKNCTALNPLKGLIDGMSNFFTPTGDRKKTVPMYAPPPRTRKTQEEKAEEQKGEETSDGGPLSDDGKVVDSIDPENLPAKVLKRDYRLFRRSQRFARDFVELNNAVPTLDGSASCPPSIQIGKYVVKTWYSSPYPQEYAQLSRVYICEFCLRYMKSRSILERHMSKCTLTHPPANEIYRKDDLSVFEVDGNTNKIYCQNLCLLAKLFLDHKTLYYDVEPFLFYVLTINDDQGCHFVGYFSKEKHCQQKYNVSCITTLPQHQRQGYGRFLIDFSYLLSRIEGTPGSPEKPLSELGRVSYQAYWKSVLLEYLANHKASTITIRQMSLYTGICAHDIAATFQTLGLFSLQPDGQTAVKPNRTIIDEYMAKKRRGRHITIDEECLRWTPLVSSQLSSSSPDKTYGSSSSPDKASSPMSAKRKRGRPPKIKASPQQIVEPEPVKSPPPKIKRQPSLNKSSKPKSTSKHGTKKKNNTQQASPVQLPKTRASSCEVKDPPIVMSPKSQKSKPLAKPSVKSKPKSGPLTNGKGSKKNIKKLAESTDENEAIVQPKPPSKRKRATCKEDGPHTRKGGSPSTPEKRGRRYGRSSRAAVASLLNGSAVNCNSKFSKATAAEERRTANGKSSARQATFVRSNYASDGSSSPSSVAESCYYASGSDSDSDNTVEHNSSDESVWSPTIRSENHKNPFDTDVQPVDNNNAQQQAHVSNTIQWQSSTVDGEEEVPIPRLPFPTSFPLNAPEIDPATLGFESPLSLSSNDTNGTATHEQKRALNNEKMVEYNGSVNYQQSHAPVTRNYGETVIEDYVENIPAIDRPYPSCVQTVGDNHTSPGSVQQDHPSPMLPPQSPCVPLSPLVSPGGKQAMYPTGPTSYIGQRQAASSLELTPPTPPPPTPSPSKPTLSPERYYQVQQQGNQVLDKLNSRGPYGTPILPTPLMNSYQTPSHGHQFVPSQYFDSTARYYAAHLQVPFVQPQHNGGNGGMYSHTLASNNPLYSSYPYS